MISRW